MATSNWRSKRRSDDSREKLAIAAVRQGNVEIVEAAYQRLRRFDSLSFLYLVTGNMDKLRKMAKIAELRSDALSLFQNTLYLGDVEARVKLLRDMGQRLFYASTP